MMQTTCRDEKPCRSFIKRSVNHRKVQEIKKRPYVGLVLVPYPFYVFLCSLRSVEKLIQNTLCKRTPNALDSV